MQQHTLWVLWIEVVLDNIPTPQIKDKDFVLSHSSGDYESLNHNQGVLS
ncbi:hypothetical protein [Nostoc sp. NMS4]|nr:hypothetical protein [Nostoc sp. NMS4]MBN3924468.1 hypothetical protein [Nostoc sp. NMS4]